MQSWLFLFLALRTGKPRGISTVVFWPRHDVAIACNQCTPYMTKQFLIALICPFCSPDVIAPNALFFDLGNALTCGRMVVYDGCMVILGSSTAYGYDL